MRSTMTAWVCACALAASVLTLPALLPSVVSAADIASVDCPAVPDIDIDTGVGDTQAGASNAVTDPDPGIDRDPASSGFTSFVPQLAERIVDTRNDIGGVSTALDAGCTLRIDTTGLAPAGATGVALSLTVVSQVEGFFTAHPCASGRPATSSVNARPGLATANLVPVAPDADGSVCIYSSAGGQLIVDVSGWWVQGNTPVTPIKPVRAYDTRQLEEPVKLPADAIRDVDVAGTRVPDDAVAVVVNLAAINPTTGGFLVVYPCGVAPPVASNLNFVAGEQRAVSAIVEVGVFGKICVTGNAETHFIIDVAGFYAPSSPFGPQVELVPNDGTRVVDTRRDDVPGERFDGGGEQRFNLSDALEHADETVAVALNVVATQPDSAGFVTVHPCLEPRPTTSSLNYAAGQTANLVITTVSADVEVCVYASTGVHLVVDLVGAVTGPEASVATQLSIAASGEFVQIDQPYLPEGGNYTMRCGDDPVDVRVRLAQIPGAVASVNRVAVDGTDADIEVPLEGLVSVEFERDGETTTHSFRCVASDFPYLAVSGTGENTDGWYLTGLGWINPNLGTFVAILDRRGVPVWFKRTDRKLIDAKLLSTGALVASPISGRGFGLDPIAGHRVFDLDGNLIAVELPDDPVTYPSDHHDYVEILGAEGQRGRATVSYPIVTGQDLTTLATIDPATGELADTRCGYNADPLDRTIAGGVVQEIPADPVSPVWNWDMLDHFGFDEVTYAQCFGNVPDTAGGEVDVFHLNSLQRITDDGCEPTCDYVASARHLDAVFRIDRATDAVEWILSSQPSDPLDPNYVANLSGAPRLRVIGDALGGPLRMHDARLAGDLLSMHDNRSGTTEMSRVVTYRIDLSDPLDPTATLVDEIGHPVGETSTQLGSARVAADGSTLVNWGATQPLFVEYGADGSEQLRIEMPSNDRAYRILKYPTDAFDLEILLGSAGGPLEAP